MKVEINEIFDWTDIRFPEVTQESYIQETMNEIKQKNIRADHKQVLNILKDKWSECLPEEQPFHIELYLLVEEMSPQDFKEWYATIGTKEEK